MPLISVVLPVYNGELYLEAAIQSIINQTFGDFELVIFNDGSEDHSLELCRFYANLDNRIRLFSSRANQGLAPTMNKLITLSQGSYIAVQEQDDLSKLNRLELSINSFNHDPTIILISGIAARLDDDDKVASFTPQHLVNHIQYPKDKIELITGLYTRVFQVVNATCMFRKTAALACPGPFDEVSLSSIDWQFFLHMAHLGTFHGLFTPLAEMRRGTNHQSLTNNTALVFREARRCIEKIYTFYKDRSDSPIEMSLFKAAQKAQELAEQDRLRG